MTRLGTHVFNECNALKTVTIDSSVIAGLESSDSLLLYHAETVYVKDGLTLGAYITDSFTISESSDKDGYGKYVLKGEDESDDEPVEPSLEHDILIIEKQNDDYIVTGVKTKDFTEVTIPNFVTAIGRSAFHNCIELASITIPNSVTSVGNYAFSYCSRLTTITIPDNVTNIGEWAFSNCSKLTSVTISDSVTSIGKHAFYKCGEMEKIIVDEDNLCYSSQDGILYNKDMTELIKAPEKIQNTFVVPASVSSIGDSAFDHCVGLTDIIIHDNVTKIGSAAFAWCSRLNNVTIPDSITSIESETFWVCSGLSSITIPDSVTSMDSNAFWGCDGLTAVYITDIAKWCNINFTETYSNPLYHAHNLYLNGELITDLIIPNSVTCISNTAFRGCNSITSITIPDSVINIEEEAFYTCYKLVEIYNFSSLDIITDSKDHGYVGYYALDVYTNLDALSKLSTTSDGYIIRTDGDEITLIGYSGSDTVLTLPDYITKINQYAFYKNTKITSLVIPNSVTSIGNYAFQDCTGLTSVVIGNNVTIIGWSAFDGCTELSSINIPDSVITIDYNAFDTCFDLTTVYITDIAKWNNINFKNTWSNPLNYAHNLYLNGELITDLVIPDNVTSISKKIFQSCIGLASITIPDNVISIGDDAFYNCTGLKTVIIDSSIIAGLESSNSYLLEYASTVYVKEGLEVGSYITDSFTLAESSDMAGYQMYIKK